MSCNGNSMSKIDRFLVNSVFISCWPSASVTVLPKELSDHCPLTLSCVSMDFGPAPFRFYNSWLEDKNIAEIVEKAWLGCNGSGSADRKLLEKLKAVKGRLKEWKADCRNKDSGKAEDCRNKLESLDLVAEDRRLSEIELVERKNLLKELTDLELARTLDLKQKARIKWAIDGDENTKFFHGIINNKVNNNRINGLSINGIWSSDPMVIKEEVVKFFANKFKEPVQNRPRFFSNNFKKLSLEDNKFLTAEFTNKEIKQAVCDRAVVTRQN
ncbi:hypothetical protein OROMI_033354 [Orobanche minor]